MEIGIHHCTHRLNQPKSTSPRRKVISNAFTNATRQVFQLLIYLVININVGPIHVIPYAGNSLWTTISLDNPPDFGVKVWLTFAIPMVDVQLSVTFLKFDSGDKEKRFKISSICDPRTATLMKQVQTGVL